MNLDSKIGSINPQPTGSIDSYSVLSIANLLWWQQTCFSYNIFSLCYDALAVANLFVILSTDGNIYPENASKLPQIRFKVQGGQDGPGGYEGGSCRFKSAETKRIVMLIKQAIFRAYTQLDTAKERFAP